MAKYGMSLMTLGLAAELGPVGIAASLWPRTTIATADLDRCRAVPGGPPLETDLFLDPLEDVQ